MLTCGKTRRHFTEAARDAAALARQRKREHKTRFPEEHQLMMVVVRAADDLRRFGHLDPVARSDATFLDPVDAARLGQVVLDGMRVAPTAE